MTTLQLLVLNCMSVSKCLYTVPTIISVCSSFRTLMYAYLLDVSAQQSEFIHRTVYSRPI